MSNVITGLTYRFLSDSNIRNLITLQDINSSNSGGTDVYFRGVGASARVFDIANTWSDISLSTANTGTAVERVRITSGGNVGIGTSNPSNRIHMSGTTANYLQIDNTSGNNRLLIGVDGGAQTSIYSRDVSDAARDFRIVSGSNESLRITAGGNVGIGTSSPSDKLYVRLGNVVAHGGSSSAPTNVSNFTSGAMYIDGSTNYAFMGVKTLYGGGGVGFVFSRGGIFDTLVQVYTNTINNGPEGAMNTPGPYVSAGGTSWTNSSDERLKENIKELPDGILNDICNLRTITFNWKNRAANKESVGLIAQDVQPLFPQIVNQDSDGFMGIEYSLMVPILLKGIKELKQQVNDLQTENTSMKNDIVLLKAHLGLQ